MRFGATAVGTPNGLKHGRNNPEVSCIGVGCGGIDG